MKNDDILAAIISAYDDADYPAAFSSGYDIMECMSDRNDICTFLVQDKDLRKYIAKCFSKPKWNGISGNEILSELSHPGLPGYIDSFENDHMSVIVREYVEGISLDRYFFENEMSDREIIDICIKLCDILSYLHNREVPVIHRDIKPQNIIVKPDGEIVLIDFDLAREYNKESETDTVFFGTRSYAPPEQYGFSQTDARADIYSLGILLRYLFTGSTKENEKIKIYGPVADVIKKCTAFSPKERFSDALQVKKALEKANPRSQFLRTAVAVAAISAAVIIIVLTGVKIYRYVFYSPFADGVIPGYLSDEERVRDAVDYMKDRYKTDMFDDDTAIAEVGDLRRAMIELYGLDRDYVYAINMDMPQESDAFFLPWGWDDKQTLDKEIAAYAAIKVHDPSIVADWSSLKDDNGYYPGVRVAVAFAEKNDILTGINNPRDITLGEMAIVLANTDRVFERGVN